MIHQAVKKKVPEYVILKKMRDIVKDIPSFNVREKAWTYRLLKKTADLMYIQNGNLLNSQIKMYYSGLNKINEHANSRKRKMNLLETMMYHRASAGVFYICSIHSNPAEDHKDYQGKIYVDRYWKDTLKGLPEMRKKVAAYIKNHGIMTVQEAIREPVYLITRPYCKHFFISLDTDEVLGNSVNKIIKNHSQISVKTHNIDYRKKFYRFRKQVYTVLNAE